LVCIPTKPLLLLATRISSRESALHQRGDLGSLLAAAEDLCRRQQAANRGGAEGRVNHAPSPPRPRLAQHRPRTISSVGKSTRVGPCGGVWVDVSQRVCPFRDTGEGEGKTGNAPSSKPVLQPAHTTRCAEAEDDDPGQGVRPDRGGLCACVVHSVCVSRSVSSRGAAASGMIQIESGEERDIAHRVRGARRPSSPSPCRSCYPTKTSSRPPSVRCPRSHSPRCHHPHRQNRRWREEAAQAAATAPVRASALPVARAPSAPAPAASAGGGVGSRTDRIAIEGVGE
jgi:hypothetical protein